MTVDFWQPTDLLERVAREPLALIRSELGHAPLLVVRLDDFSNDLGLGLAAADQVAHRRRANRAIKTTLQLSPVMLAQLHALRTEKLSLPPPAQDVASKASGPPAGFPAPEWLNARCYVVRLAHRSDGAAPLSIGRDGSHDIVLQHPSVSATHALLQVGEELSLRDAKSRNGTWVNDAPVTDWAPVRVGDRIKFAAVQAVLCSVDDLWRALR